MTLQGDGLHPGNMHQGQDVSQVHWNGRDDKGIEILSGIYFSRVLCGNVTATKKLILIS
jgi:hypothetical protein